jgi:MFS family permease
MGLFALIGFGLCAWLLPATHHEAVLRKGHQPLQWRVILSDRTIVGLFVFRLAYTAGIGIIWGFLPVLAASEFSLTSSEIGVLVMLGVLVSGLIQAPMGYLADRISRKAMVVVGGGLAGLSILCFQWADTYEMLFGASIAFGLGGGIAMPAVMAVAVLKGNQTNSMGSVMAIMTVGHSLGMLTGAVIAGIMMDWFDLRMAFRFGSVMLFTGVAIFYLSVAGVRVNSNRSGL